MTCETHELTMSAWLDGEPGESGRDVTLDHLVRCGSCRRFWAEARALDDVLVAHHDRRPHGVTGDPPSAELWERIRDAGAGAPRPVAPLRPARRLVPVWAMRAAAALVLALGLSVLLLDVAVDGPAPDGRAVAVTLGDDAGRMDELRFVALTRELLEADPVYHRAMHRVMDEVLRETGAVEASSEGRTPHVDVWRNDETTTDERGPA